MTSGINTSCATLVLLVTLAISGSVLLGQEKNEPKVEVCREDKAVGTVYHYRITNSTSYPIISLLIGIGIDSWVPELSLLPVGCSSVCEVPDESYSAPPTWNAEIQRVVEVEGFLLKWSTRDAQQPIAPGQTLSGFRIVLPDRDDQYENGHWTAYPNVLGYFSGVLEANPEVCPP